MNYLANPFGGFLLYAKSAQRILRTGLILLVWLGASDLGLNVGRAQETCIPVGTGGPYNHLSGGAPKFWDPATYSFNSCSEDNFNRFNKWIDDPRWDGSTSTTHGYGTTEIMQFRAVQRPVGSQNYLFLSWWVKNTASLSSPSNNMLYVGFRPDDSTSPGIVLRLVVGQATNAVGEPAVLGAATSTLYVLTSEVLPASNTNRVYSGTSGTQALPSWAQDSRVWIGKSRPDATTCQPGPAVVWAFHLRVPLQTNISPDAAHQVVLGPSPQRKFRLWYSARFDTPAGIVPLTWPRTTSTNNYDIQQPPPDFLDATPSFSQWPVFYLSTGSADATASCTSGGITIESADISVSYPGSTDDWHIGIPATSGSPQPVNTFHARPTNKSGHDIPRSDLHALFRMASWGAQLQDGEAIPGTGEWITIGGLGDVTDNAGGNVVNNGKWDIHKDKQFSFNEFVGKSKHQCIQVDLFGGGGTGLSFLKSSAFRNMHTTRLSTLREDAEVALTGLSVGASRDVFLYVEPHNMPRTDFRGPLPEGILLTQPVGGGRDKTPTGTAESSIHTPEYEQRASVEPAYIVRAFYDSGRKTRASGQDRTCLQPMVSFGYFAEHPEDLAGWRHELEGAERIAENWYRLHVNGKTSVTIELEAVEPFRFGVALAVGMTFPHGTFGTIYQSDLSFGLELEYRISNAYALCAAVMRDRFKPKSGAQDLAATTVAVRGRRYVLDGATRPFVSAGAVSYSFNPGQTRTGITGGIGIQHNFDPRLAVEASYDFQAVANYSPISNYSTAHVGLRVRF